jgi:DNA invertase Pin-like site-specific DNA recombinase
MKASIYSRVSTDDQTTANQIERLEAVAKFKGWDVVHRYSDEGISGAKGREQRPGLDAALKGAERHSYDVLMVWSVDRIGRSTIDTLRTSETLRVAGRQLYIDQGNIDTTTPQGQAFYGMHAIFAELERSQIVARVNAGIARARKAGKRLGRPRVDPDIEAKVRGILATGAGINKTAKLAGCANGTVSRIRASAVRSMLA